MLFSTALKRSGMSLMHMQRRKAGGFPPSMAVRKNMFLEEWNGKREITEKTFSVEFDNVSILIIYLMLVPYGIYTWSRSEFLSKGDRRYKELV